MESSSINVNSVSRISEGTVIKGEVFSPSDIRIDGTFEGKIISKGRVVVGEKATIKGDIICENIDIWGKLEGCVYTKDTLSLKEGCQLDGNINVRRLAVELGAVLNGTCKTITESEFDKYEESLVKPVAHAAVKPSAAPQASANPASAQQRAN